MSIGPNCNVQPHAGVLPSMLIATSGAADARAFADGTYLLQS